MYIRRNIKWKFVMRLSIGYLIFYFCYSALVVYLYHFLDHLNISDHNGDSIDISIPFMPLSTIGIAVAFYLGFKNNQAYDRFWEARKIWGGIVNYSRTWGNQVTSFVSNLQTLDKKSPEELHKIHQTMIYRHIAWLYALTHHLRRSSPFSNVYKGLSGKLHLDRPDQSQLDSDVKPLLPEYEYTRVNESVNMPTQIIKIQG